MLSKRPQGSLPSTTENNPKEQAFAISLRSGKELPAREAEKEALEDEKKAPESVVEKEAPKEAKAQSSQGADKHEVEMFEPQQRQSVPVKEYKPRIPYPARLLQTKDKEQYGKFLELFKQLHINIPFFEAIAQMPKYAKCLKELLTNKQKLEEVSSIEVGANCSSIIQNTLPPKLEDPGSFNIPCVVGEISATKALADLGASINLMPYSFFSKLGLTKLRPTKMKLQLADRSVKIPIGIIEDVLVKVGNLLYPVDFVVLDIEEDRDPPLLLGRPFLATAGALIDVRERKLTLRAGEEELVIQVTAVEETQVQTDPKSCYSIDEVNFAGNKAKSKDEVEQQLELIEKEEVQNPEVEAIFDKSAAKEKLKSQKKLDNSAVESQHAKPMTPELKRPPDIKGTSRPTWGHHNFNQAEHKEYWVAKQAKIDVRPPPTKRKFQLAERRMDAHDVKSQPPDA